MTEQGIEERRLAGIGRSRDHDERPGVEPLALGRGREQAGETIADDVPGPFDLLRRYGAFVFLREVDVVGDEGFELQDLVTQRLEAA